MILFPGPEPLFEKYLSVLICQGHEEQHGVDHGGDGVVGQVDVLGQHGHEDGVHDSRGYQPKAVDDVQPLETDGVLDPRLDLVPPLQPEHDLDAESRDEHEGGGDDLDGYPNVGHGGVHRVQGDVGQKSLIFGQIKAWTDIFIKSCHNTKSTSTSTQRQL